jgi:cell division protein FtsX
VPELDLKLKSFRIEPQSKEQAQEIIRKLKADIGMANVKADKKKVRQILRRAGSLTDEILKSREKARRK